MESLQRVLVRVMGSEFQNGEAVKAINLLESPQWGKGR